MGKIDETLTAIVDGILVGIGGTIRFSKDFIKVLPYYYFGKLPSYVFGEKWYCNKIGIDNEERKFCLISGKFYYKIFAKTLCDYVDEKHTKLGIKNYYCRCKNENK